MKNLPPKDYLIPVKMGKVICSGGTWKPSGTHLMIDETRLRLANYKILGLPDEENEGNMVLAAASKMMCQRINQTISILQTYIDHKDAINSSSEDSVYSKMRYLQALLLSALPKELREEDHPSEEWITNVIDLVKMSMDGMNSSEKEVLKTALISYE